MVESSNKRPPNQSPVLLSEDGTPGDELTDGTEPLVFKRPPSFREVPCPKETVRPRSGRDPKGHIRGPWTVEKAISSLLQTRQHGELLHTFLATGRNAVVVLEVDRNMVLVLTGQTVSRKSVTRPNVDERSLPRLQGPVVGGVVVFVPVT